MTLKSLLTKQDMLESKNVPEWLVKEYQAFHQVVTEKTFPCFLV
ncbi:FPC/CPF motif-containing protein YcgG [Alkalihalobacillus xiaoxiensis]|uniref:FPC/CPF motif-containing protein YcgG n=1 Tax=Shouchella xiaoxiensis TaxID=766895 RepID=A0ABS2SYV3_9BACI|nr:FPC/CPF motif-containing protein YcgG [Shouchella xiaoxiensis]